MESNPASLPADRRTGRLRQSVGVKVLVIAALVLLLLIPLSMLDSLIYERQQMRENVQREVSAQWGLDQTIGGPVISVPYAVQQTLSDGTASVRRGFVHFLPERLDIEAALRPQVRKRDIYEVILYGSTVTLTGHFGSLDPRASGIASEAIDWSRAVLSVGISDLSGLKSLATLDWGGAAVQAEPGLPTTDVFGSGLSYPIRIAADTARMRFSLPLDLNGSTSFSMLPFGKETTARVRGGWGTPSFTGTFLPEPDYVLNDTLFDARWRVLYLNRNYPQTFAGAIQRSEMDRMVHEPSGSFAGPAREGGLGAFGVRLLLPLDEYQKTMRSAEYGALCLILTFVTIFFVEILGRRRTHPLQYLLVGFAVALFYLLLLAFAEYMRFNAAYALAAVSVLTLIFLYARAVFRSWRYAGVVTALLVVFYGYFFVLLQAEAYALLLGSLGLLLILGAVMYLSRNVDWYAVGTRERDGLDAS